MKNREVEFKFLISKEQKHAILEKLKLSGEFILGSWQIDTYYIPKFKNFEINGETCECLRVRTTDKGNVLCYKKIHREANPIYCDEYETKIEDSQMLEKILFSLGFEIQMKIDKTRESWKLDDLEFDFDSVVNLGELMEVEIKTDDEQNAENKIFEFLKEFNLSRKDVNYEGIQMLMKKKMLEGKND